MRFGLFVLCLASVLVVLALTIPVPAFQNAGGPAEPASAIAPTCLSFPRDTSAWAAAFPESVRLGLREYPFLTDGPQRYAVESLTAADRGLTAWWRPAGADSVDLAFYPHTVLRLPLEPLATSEGDTVVGRMGAWRHASLFEAIFGSVEYGRVVPIPRPLDTSAPAG